MSDGIKIITVVFHHMFMTDYDGVPEVWREKLQSIIVGTKGEIRAYVCEEKTTWQANGYFIDIKDCTISMEPEWEVNDLRMASLVD